MVSPEEAVIVVTATVAAVCFQIKVGCLDQLLWDDCPKAICKMPAPVVHLARLTDIRTTQLERHATF